MRGVKKFGPALAQETTIPLCEAGVHTCKPGRETEISKESVKMAIANDITHTNTRRFRSFIRYITWPVLMIACVWMIHLGISKDQPIIYFNITYFSLALIICVLERIMPHEECWLKSDGQIVADLGHTVLSKIPAQIWAGLIILGILEVAGNDGGVLWPKSWHPAIQVIFGLLVAEFGLYWAHRFAHQWPFLWRFHAVHHSVVRLWFVNTGRFHIMDAMVSISLGQAMLLIAGAPEFVMLWTAMLTPFIGFLTHCNIDMRFGLLSYIFNTPELHRWHHSRSKEEGNTNYGENFMLWDQLFGTFFNPPRRPSPNIGIGDFMPQSFWGQLKCPFVWDRQQAETHNNEASSMNNLAAKKPKI